MILIGITMGGPALPSRIRAAERAGAWVLVRELELPADLPDGALILHARMPGAEDEARRRGFGLHLGSGGDVGALRRRFAGRLGVSAHARREADAALAAGADYALLGPVWAPSSKPGRPPIGLAHVAGHVALGGVSPARARECRDAGAVGVAAMGGIFGAPGEEAPRVAAYLAMLRA